MMDKVTGNRLAADLNEYLIDMWIYLVYGADKIDFFEHIPFEKYSEQRDLYNLHKKQKIVLDDSEIAIVGWTGFAGSFNGRFFDGGYSGHDVKGRDYIGEQVRNIKSQAKALKGTKFVHSDYLSLEIPEHSIIYCDPPYKGTKQYTYKVDYDRFWQWCRDMAKMGHKVFISEYEAPEDFKCVWEKETKTAMNQKITKKATEKLFVYNG